MSTIQLHSPQTRPFTPTPRDAAPSTQNDSRKRHSDDEMMYAWSIGVTSAARAMASDRQSNDRHTADAETCPPEVYIG